MNIVNREEKKFLISIEEFRNKSHYLDGLMIQDEHNGIDGYVIRSLYFDTVYDDDFFEKLEGIETRRKIRLRIYDPKQEFAMLEMKQKQGPSQLKRSLKMRLDQGQRIVEVLKQGRNAPVRVGCQVAIVYAAIKGYLDSVAVSEVKEYEKRLYALLENKYGDWLARIEEGYYEAEDEEKLKAILSEMR